MGEMRSIGDVLDKEQVEALEERARAAERRVSVARTAMTRYVSESQKCSPAPFVYSTVDDLTPMKRAVENWMEFSGATSRHVTDATTSRARRHPPHARTRAETSSRGVHTNLRRRASPPRESHGTQRQPIRAPMNSRGASRASLSQCTVSSV